MNNTWLHDPGRFSRCTIIAEVAQAHDGSLGMAHAYIDAIADAGADAVKFQTHIASAESTPSEPWRVRFSQQDATRYAYWQRMEFSSEQWHGLKRHADDRGLLFVSSPFSLQAVALLREVGVAGWKLASGEFGSDDIIDSIIATGEPVLLSTGMSTYEEVDRLVQRIRSSCDNPLALMQCTSMYPTPPEQVGLNVIGEYRERFQCAVGLSDHSATIYPGIAAATGGIQVLEVHVTLSRQMFGPDVVASLTSQELAQLVHGVRYIETMNAHPVDKNTLPGSVRPLREVFRKSVVASCDLSADTLLEDNHLVLKKPGTGIPAERLRDVVGRRLRRGVKRDELLDWSDLEEAT
jgi:N-acetylneuraminate synthase